MAILFIWDFHGVLEKDNINALEEFLNYGLEKRGHDRRITKKECRQWYGLSFDDYIKNLLPRADEAERKKVAGVCSEVAWDHIKKHIKPQDMAEEVLERIALADHCNIVVSNSTPAAIYRFVDLVGLTRYFDEVIGVDRDEQEEDYSHIEAKAEAIEKYLADKEFDRLVLVGDREDDIKVGQRLGAVTYLFDPDDFRKRTSADFKIKELERVLNQI